MHSKLIVISILVVFFASFVYYFLYVPVDVFETGFRNLTNSGNVHGPWSYKRKEIAVYAVQGKRPYMEDRFSIVESDRFVGFAVYDGHGGSFFSDYAERYLLSSIADKVLNSMWVKPNVSQILMDEYLKLDMSAMLKGGKEQKMCGSTALVAIIYENKLYIANTGDCRAVAKRVDTTEAFQITVDHKPNEPGELARIQAAGGTVLMKGVWRVGGMLAVSRAFGDGYLKEKGWLIAQPDVFTIDLNKMKIQYVLLASDGLWDVFDSQQAVDFLSSYLKNEPFFGAKQIAEKALKKGSMDNICVLIAKLTNS